MQLSPFTGLSCFAEPNLRTVLYSERNTSRYYSIVFWENIKFNVSAVTGIGNVESM
jgi:hypothetical protein